MATLELYKKAGTYENSRYIIHVEKTNFDESDSFDLFVHSFRRNNSFSVFTIKYNYYETTVITNLEYKQITADNFKVFFSKLCPDQPLIFGLSTKDGNSCYYRWREFKNKYTVYLSNYEQIKSTDLLAELNKENLNVNSETFQISSTYSYLEIIIEKGDFEDDFKSFTHKSYKTYTFLKLKSTLKCKLENYNPSSFNSTNLSNLCVYFHKNDTQHFYPLLLEFQPRPNFNTVYYQLVDINTQLDFKTVDNTTKLDRDGLAKCLNETYVKLHGKFDPKPTNTLLTYYHPTTLGVTPPFKDQSSSVTYLQLNLFAVFGSLFVLAGIFYFLYQFYIRMKFKYY